MNAPREFMNYEVTFIDGPLAFQRRVLSEAIVMSGYYRTVDFQPMRPIAEDDRFADVANVTVPVLLYVLHRIERRNKFREKVLYVAYQELQP